MNTKEEIRTGEDWCWFAPFYLLEHRLHTYAMGFEAFVVLLAQF